MAVRNVTRRGPVAVLVGVFLVVMAFGVGTAGAHNELTGVDPVDGSIVDRAGTIRFRFLNPVPLDTMSVEAIDASGARTPIEGLRHGEGTTEVVVDAADLPAGAVTLRWRLVGADGHVVTDRVQYGIADGGSVAGVVAPSSVTDSTDGAPSPVGPAGRWLLRTASYVALMAFVGGAVTQRWLWPGLGSVGVLRHATSVGLVLIGLLSLVQIVELAAQIDGVEFGSAIGRWQSALRARAGDALAWRAVLAALGVVFFAVVARIPRTVADGLRAVVVVLLLGTWSFAGHAASGRWSALGVVVDGAHHGAAAAWIGGLAVLAMGLRTMPGDEVALVMTRFSAAAPWLVGTLAVTGVVAKLRLLDGPSSMIGAHSLVLVAKLAVVACTLWIADLNRRRVQRWCDEAESFGVRRIDVLRRAMTTEAVSGVVVLAITAVLVVTAS